jgi:hypothetical protein
MRSPGLLVGAMILVAASSAVHAAPRSWTAPTAPEREPQPYLGSHVIAVGQHTAIGVLELHPAESGKRSARKVVAKTLAHLAYDPATGVRGPLKLPAKAIWVGLGAGDVVLAATPNGTLWRAPSIDAAIAGAFVEQGRVPGAKRWDANPAASIVLATVGRAIAISADGGATFTRITRPRALDGAFVRADGIIVADPQGAPPEVSRDGGVTWTSAPGEVGSLVVTRNGNWIGERDSDGAVTCRSGALAADGQTWVAWEYWREKPGGQFKEVWSDDGLHDRWNQRLLDYPTYQDEASSTATNVETDPMPKPDAGDLAAYHARCKPVAEGGMGGILGMGGLSEPECQGADCVTTAIGQRQTSYLVQTRVFHDGAPPKRSASAVIIDLRSARHALLVPPAGCDSVLLEDVAGAAVLGCRAGDGADLHLGGLDGVWHPAGHVRGEPEDAKRAADGTIVLTASCRPRARDCIAWVRRPAPLEDSAAFEAIEVPGARAFGAMPAGKVLVAAVAPARAEDRSWIYLSNKGLFDKAAKTDADRPAALTGKLGALADCFHALGAGRQPGEIAVQWSKSGTLIGEGPAELRSCASRILGKLPTTIAPGKNVLYFRVIKHAIDLLEVVPGQAAAPLARDLAFDGELSSIQLDPRGQISFTAYRSRPYVSTTYRVDRRAGTAKPLPATR